VQIHQTYLLPSITYFQAHVYQDFSSYTSVDDATAHPYVANLVALIVIYTTINFNKYLLEINLTINQWTITIHHTIQYLEDNNELIYEY